MTERTTAEVRTLRAGPRLSFITLELLKPASTTREGVPRLTYVLDTVPAFNEWYRTKFDETGNVNPEWRLDTWSKLLDLPKSPSPSTTKILQRVRAGIDTDDD
jgi:hypothetical protein